MAPDQAVVDALRWPTARGARRPDRFVRRLLDVHAPARPTQRQRERVRPGLSAPASRSRSTAPAIRLPGPESCPPLRSIPPASTTSPRTTPAPARHARPAQPDDARVDGPEPRRPRSDAGRGDRVRGRPPVVPPGRRRDGGLLGTARRRSSVRRHSRLLDYPFHDGSNARVWIVATVAAGDDGTLLPAGTVFAPDEGLPDNEPTRPRGSAVARGTPTFEALHDVTLRAPPATRSASTRGATPGAVCRAAPRRPRCADRPQRWGWRAATCSCSRSSAAGGWADHQRRPGSPSRGPPGRGTRPRARPARRRSTSSTFAGSTRTRSRSRSRSVMGTVGREPWSTGNVVLADHGLTHADPPVLVPLDGPFRPSPVRGPVTQGGAVRPAVWRVTAPPALPSSRTSATRCRACGSTARACAGSRGATCSRAMVLPRTSCTSWRRTGAVGFASATTSTGAGRPSWSRSGAWLSGGHGPVGQRRARDPGPGRGHAAWRQGCPKPAAGRRRHRAGGDGTRPAPRAAGVPPPGARGHGGGLRGGWPSAIARSSARPRPGAGRAAGTRCT